MCFLYIYHTYGIKDYNLGNPSTCVTEPWCPVAFPPVSLAELLRLEVILVDDASLPDPGRFPEERAESVSAVSCWLPNTPAKGYGASRKRHGKLFVGGQLSGKVPQQNK